MRLRLMVLAFVLLAALPVAAQEQGGSIQGVVRDASGGVLPGVTVEVRSPSVVGVNTAVTDGQGIFRFPALPPGNYEVTATLQGFTTARSNAALALGQLLNLQLMLEVAGVTETVQVTGESPLIDVKQNASFNILGEEVLKRVPKGRDFTDVINLAPGTQAESKSGGIQIDGASGSENRFIIDGMDTTALQNGTQGKTMLLDFVQEVQVKSSGYNAEFGGSTGGVISAITKSGSNNFRGMGGIYYQNDSMYGERRPSVRFSPVDSVTPEFGLLYPDTGWSYKSPLFDIGGPILRDKLWFYMGYGYTRNDYEVDATFYADPTRTPRNMTRFTGAHYINYNISTQLSNNIRVKFSASNQRNTNRRSLPSMEPDNGLPLADGSATKGMTRSTFYADPEAFEDYWGKTGTDSLNDTYSGNLDWVLTPSFFINTTAGVYRTNTWSPEEWRGTDIRHSFQQSNIGMAGVPVDLQQQSGYITGKSTYGRLRDKFQRTFFNANSTLFKSWLGQHTMKAGVRFERFENDVFVGNSQPTVNLYWGQPYTAATTGVTHMGDYGYYTVGLGVVTRGKVHSNNWSLWLQDSWTINNKLTINAGVRTENELVPSYKDAADAIDISFGFKDKIAPRVGFAYDVQGDGRWKVYGSYGWFYDITKLELPRGSFGGDKWFVYYWELDTPNWPSIQCQEGPSGCPGTFIESVDLRHSSNQVDPLFEQYYNRPGMTGVDPNIKPVRTGEFTGGLDRELTSTMSIGMRYVHKWMTRTIEDVGIFVDGVEAYLISNPGEGYAEIMEPRYPSYVTPKPKRQYDGIEVHLRKRLANNWSADISYLYSRLYGNYGGLSSSDENGRNSPNVNRYYDNTIMMYGSDGKPVYGLLNTDRPHQLKVSGSYDFKWGTSVGGYWTAQSGTPQTTVIRYRGYPIYPYGRNDLGRFGRYNRLDAQITQEFRFGTRRLSLEANIDNVFDQKTATGWYLLNLYGNQPLRDSIAPSLDLLYQPGGYDIDQIIADYSGNKRPNPFFKHPNSFLGRREIRVAAKFYF